MATVFTASAQSLPSEFCGGPNHEFLVKRGDIVMGDEGAQIYVSSARRVAVFDDFLGDAVDARWNFGDLCRIHPCRWHRWRAAHDHG
jgi:hypothetical protein